MERELLRERKLEWIRRGLRPLLCAQFAQGALGVGLIVLGVSCWMAHLQVPAMLATGLLVHAFGVLTSRNCATSTASTRMSADCRVGASGYSWYWRSPRWNPAATPTWALIKLEIGGTGLLATVVFIAWRRRSGRGPGALSDGSAAIRRGQRMLGELADTVEECTVAIGRSEHGASLESLRACELLS